MESTVQSMRPVTVTMMDVTRFWEIIAMANWETHCETVRGYGLSKRILKRELPTLDVMLAFRKRFDHACEEVSKRIQDAERRSNRNLPVSDDGLVDLLAHIVGMGEGEYAEVMMNPDLAYLRAFEGRYVESFCYAIPYDNEYAEGYTELQRRQRQRDHEILIVEEHLRGVLEPAIELAIREQQVLHADHVIGAVRSVCDQMAWKIRRAMPETDAS